MTNDILTRIIAAKRLTVDEQKQALPPHELEQSIRANPPRPHLSMQASLLASPVGIIAEFKRRSPSKGWINEAGKVSNIIPSYERAGAAAISVLTDEPFFGGSPEDLRQARLLTQIPLLRKDFIIDPYQLYQAVAWGADAVLLIAACLSVSQCQELTEQAHALGLEVLLELHEESELEYLSTSPNMVGVNNRNLGSFVTTIDTSFSMAEQLRQKGTQAPPVWVSESGISDIHTLQRLRTAGYRGFLVGEALMKGQFTFHKP